MLNVTHYLDTSSWQAIVFLIGTFLSSAVSSGLSWRNTLGTGLKERLSSLRSIHPIAKELFTEKKIEASEKYATDNRNLSEFSDTVTSGMETLLLIFGVSPMVMGGIFSIFPNLYPSVGIPLSFFLVSLMTNLYEIPFSYLDTFVVEERNGFNRTTRKTFFSDISKGLLVKALYSMPLSIIFAEILSRFGEFSLLNLALFSISMVAFRPVSELFEMYVIMPMFNKFKPLKKGYLRSRIESMLEENGMKAGQIVVMDSSRRSSKSNAFVHGFGRKKRIVLFDELLKNQSNGEILSIVAHEIGHAKLGHILFLDLISIVSSVATISFAFFMMNDISLYRAFGYWFVDPENLHSFRFVGFGLSAALLGAVSWIFSPVFSWISRKMEYAADRFSVKENGKEFLRTSLLKLHSENLSNVSPDPLYEAWNYSHPSILPRLQALGSIPDRNERWSSRKTATRKGKKRRQRRGKRGTNLGKPDR